MVVAKHLFVCEKTKKLEAGGMGRILVAAFTSDIRRGRAKPSSPSCSSGSISSETQEGVDRPGV